MWSMKFVLFFRQGCALRRLNGQVLTLLCFEEMYEVTRSVLTPNANPQRRTKLGSHAVKATHWVALPAAGAERPSGDVELAVVW